MFHKTNDIIWLFFPHHYAIFRVLTLFTPFPLHLPLPASPGSYIALQTSSFFKFGACVTLSQKPQITPLQQQWIRNNFVLAIKNRREERARERSKGKIQLSCSRDHQRRRRAIGVSNSLGGRVVQGTPPKPCTPHRHPVILHLRGSAQQPLELTRAWISGFELQDVCSLTRTCSSDEELIPQAASLESHEVTSEIFILSSSNTKAPPSLLLSTPDYVVGPALYDVKLTSFLVSHKAWGLARASTSSGFQQSLSMFFPFWQNFSAGFKERKKKNQFPSCNMPLQPLLRVRKYNHHHVMMMTRRWREKKRRGW